VIRNNMSLKVLSGENLGGSKKGLINS
jgi:hypothetical protein